MASGSSKLPLWQMDSIQRIQESRHQNAYRVTKGNEVEIESATCRCGTRDRTDEACWGCFEGLSLPAASNSAKQPKLTLWLSALLSR